MSLKQIVESFRNLREPKYLYKFNISIIQSLSSRHLSNVFIRIYSKRKFLHNICMKQKYNKSRNVIGFRLSINCLLLEMVRQSMHNRVHFVVESMVFHRSIDLSQDHRLPQRTRNYSHHNHLNIKRKEDSHEWK